MPLVRQKLPAQGNVPVTGSPACHSGQVDSDCACVQSYCCPHIVADEWWFGGGMSTDLNRRGNLKHEQRGRNSDSRPLARHDTPSSPPNLSSLFTQKNSFVHSSLGCGRRIVVCGWLPKKVLGAEAQYFRKLHQVEGVVN